jgi:transposase
LDKQGADNIRAVMEAGGIHGEELAFYYPSDAGHCISIVNPVRIKAFGQNGLQRNRTDRRIQ